METVYKLFKCEDEVSIYDFRRGNYITDVEPSTFKLPATKPPSKPGVPPSDPGLPLIFEEPEDESEDEPDDGETVPDRIEVDNEISLNKELEIIEWAPPVIQDVKIPEPKTPPPTTFPPPTTRKPSPFSWWLIFFLIGALLFVVLVGIFTFRTIYVQVKKSKSRSKSAFYHITKYSN